MEQQEGKFIRQSNNLPRFVVCQKKKVALTNLIGNKGGPGSGHHGHAGRPGKRGGSLPGRTGLQGFTEQWAGSSVEVSSGILEKLDKAVGRPPFGKPLTEGKPRWCQENARLEYQRQKQAGNSPVFVEGDLITVTRDQVLRLADSAHRNGREPSQQELKEWLWPVQHAWVEVNGKILDPTPILIGNGQNAAPVWVAAMFSRYGAKRRISGADDWVLEQPLTMPTEASGRLPTETGGPP